MGKKKITKVQCDNCIIEMPEDKVITDSEGNVFCSKECAREFRFERNQELMSSGN